MPFKVIQAIESDMIWSDWPTYDFVLVIHNKYGPVMATDIGWKAQIFRRQKHCI